jgi:hypothetical protein
LRQHARFLGSLVREGELWYEGGTERGLVQVNRPDTDQFGDAA